MGVMKEYLCNKITEFAALYGLDESEIYQNDALYAQAVEFAESKLIVGHKFKFVCLDCGTPFEEMVELGMVEIYTDIQSDSHTEVLNGWCPRCRVK